LLPEDMPEIQRGNQKPLDKEKQKTKRKTWVHKYTTQKTWVHKYTTQKTTYLVARTSLKSVSKLNCSGSVKSSCFISGTICVTK
jgi:hypothetical protein